MNVQESLSREKHFSNIFRNIFSAGDTGVLKHNFRDCGRSELIRTFNFEEKVRITVEQWHSRKQLDSRVIVWRIAHDQVVASLLCNSFKR